MFRKAIAVGLILLMLLNVCAFAESFLPKHVAETGYTETQWLTNDNSRALLVCMAVSDYCSAEGISLKNVLPLVVSHKSYIREESGLEVFIPDGDSCLGIKIKFDGAAVSASASQYDTAKIDKNSGNWYTVTPESCAVILSD